MPQIINGKYPAWVAGDIVTAADLNAMIDSATLDPLAITAQTPLTTLTGNEYSLIVDTAGLLKKTQVKNITESGGDVITDNINGSTLNGTLLVQGNGTNASIIINSNAAVNGGLIDINSKDVSISGVSSLDNSGSITMTAGTGGMSFNSGNAVTEFLSKVDLNTTGALKLPVGTTAQRPAIPAVGDLRFNTTTTDTEFYNGTAWESSNPVSAITLSANGFIKLANGLTLQWGTFLTNGSTTIASPQIIALPTTFTTAIVYANCSPDGANSGGTELAQIDWTTSGKTTTSQLGVYSNYIGTCKFFAIGY